MDRLKLKLNGHLIGQSIAILAGALALKAYYSTASVDGLRWILSPTTYLVEIVTGKQFEFEAHAGYMSLDHTFLIAASCAGVNFLLTAFMMLSLTKLWDGRNHKLAWGLMPTAALAAYVTTLMANTVRISIAIFLQGTTSRDSWLNPAEVHRVEGILIYFAFLLLLLMFSYRRNFVSSSFDLITLLKLSTLPLLIYYATTLGIPLVNGAYKRGDRFSEHAIFVLLTPLVLIVPFALVIWIVGRMRKTVFAHKVPTNSLA